MRGAKGEKVKAVDGIRGSSIIPGAKFCAAAKLLIPETKELN